MKYDVDTLKYDHISQELRAYVGDDLKLATYVDEIDFNELRVDTLETTQRKTVVHGSFELVVTINRGSVSLHTIR